jgi:hypothetical protein
MRAAFSCERAARRRAADLRERLRRASRITARRAIPKKNMLKEYPSATLHKGVPATGCHLF